MADIKHGERLINTDDPAALEALRHRPSHSTGTRRHVENLFISLQNEHFSQFLGEIGADLRSAAIKLCRVLRIIEMSFVPVPAAMPMFVIGSMIMVVIMFVVVSVFVTLLVVMIMPMNVLVIVSVFMTVVMSVVMSVAVLVMLMFVSVIVFMVVFMFVLLAHGFVIPSNEIRFIFAHLYYRWARQARNAPADLKFSTRPSYPIRPVPFKINVSPTASLESPVYFYTGTRARKHR
jgi:hypothetical protein